MGREVPRNRKNEKKETLFPRYAIPVKSFKILKIPFIKFYHNFVKIFIKFTIIIINVIKRTLMQNNLYAVLCNIYLHI